MWLLENKKKKVDKEKEKKKEKLAEEEIKGADASKAKSGNHLIWCLNEKKKVNEKYKQNEKNKCIQIDRLKHS